MKLINQLITLVVFISLYSCSLSNNKSPAVRPVILNQDLNIECSKVLSDIATDVSYIRLQTDSSCYIAHIDNIILNKQYIVIHDRFLNKALLFNTNGKFLSQISRKGKGPDEYLFIQDITLINDSILGINTEGEQFKMFLLPTGNFIEGFMLDGKPSFVRNFNSRYLMVYPQPLNTLNEGFTFSIYNKAANLISQKRYCASGWNKLDDKILHPNIYTFYDTICFWEKYSDTIYGISKNGNLKPRWYFKETKREFSHRKHFYRTLTANPLNDAFYLYNFVESPRYFFLKTVLNQRRHYLLYTKKNDKVFKISEFGDNPGLLNDIDGGLPFFPQYFQDSILFSEVDLNKIKQQKHKKHKDYLDIKSTIMNEELKMILEKTSPNDNPTIMIVKLKKLPVAF